MSKDDIRNLDEMYDRMKHCPYDMMWAIHWSGTEPYKSALELGNALLYLSRKAEHDGLRIGFILN